MLKSINQSIDQSINQQASKQASRMGSNDLLMLPNVAQSVQVI